MVTPCGEVLHKPCILSQKGCSFKSSCSVQCQGESETLNKFSITESTRYSYYRPVLRKLESDLKASALILIHCIFVCLCFFAFCFSASFWQFTIMTK